MRMRTLTQHLVLNTIGKPSILSYLPSSDSSTTHHGVGSMSEDLASRCQHEYEALCLPDIPSRD